MLDVFVYSRDAAGSGRLREDDDLLEEHWSYMDAFAESMIARGPTFASDRETVTGSLHILGLPSVDAAHEFVAASRTIVQASTASTRSGASRICSDARCGSSCVRPTSPCS